MRFEELPVPATVLATVLAWSIVAATPARAAVVCDAAALCGSGSGPCTIAGTHDVVSGCHLDFGSRAITLTGTLQAQVTGSSFSLTAGSLVLSGGNLRSVGNVDEGGGDVEVTVAGAFRMEGIGARIDTGAGAGAGDITIDAGTIDLAAGRIIADGGGTEFCGDGGAITLNASGAVVIDAPLDSTAGAACGGGTISISGSTVDVRKAINVSGGDAGLAAIEITALGGGITVQPTAPLRANGSPVEVDTGGSGGEIVLSAAGGVVLSEALEATGALVDGSGGVVEITAGGDVIASEVITVDGIGAYSYGGSVFIEAGGRIDLAKDVRARGGIFAAGGTVDLAADGDVTLYAGGSILADGGVLGPGFIDVFGRSNGLFLGGLRARGLSGGPGGGISIETCSVDVRSTLDVAAGSGALEGFISLRGGTVSVGAGASLLATGCPPGVPCNTIEVRSGQPSIHPTAAFVPAPVIAVDPSIDACCGNSALDPGETCDDGNALSCDGCSRSCTTETTPPCPPDGNACTNDCSPIQGCSYAPLTGPACGSDGNACTNDVCKAGACTHPPKSCNDGVACTVDSCDPASGCQSEPDDDRCADGSSCTAETCDPATGCVYAEEPDGTACDDESLCTFGETCQGGQCVPAQTAECDDGNPCTTDACWGFLGCINMDEPSACPCSADGTPVPAGTTCADGDSCTQGETCDGAGNCTGGALACDDGDACTIDACAGGLFCTHTDSGCSAQCVGQPDGTPCSDGAVCTVGACEGGTCVSEPLVCSDGDDCNGIEGCVGAAGCRLLSYPGPACSAGLPPLLCYRSATSRGAPKLVPESAVDVADAFTDALLQVKRVRDVCLPADVAGSAPAAPDAPGGLLGYLARRASGQPPFAGIPGVRVATAYGEITLDLRAPERLRVPTALDPAVPPGPPTGAPHALTCYRARLARGSTVPPPPQAVPVEDAFGSLVIDVRKPTHLCLPADLAGQDPAAPASGDRLACFQARTTKGTPGFVRRNDVHVENNFGAGRINALRLADVCIPAAIVP